MRYLLSCLLLLGLWGRAQAQIERVEYFFDTDPGFGRATRATVPQTANVNTSFSVPLATVSTGFHMLYLRTRDLQRRWSHTTAQPVFVTNLVTGSVTLSRAEYFLDTDPGLGRGTTITTLPANQTSTGFNFPVPLTGVALGFHALYMRTRDTQGAWSHTQQHPFYVLNLPPATQALTRAEYFIDTDPGLGRGTAVPNLPTGQTSISSHAFPVDLRTATLGGHVLYVRIADRNGAWSEAQPYAFVAQPGGALATIKAFKYNFTNPTFTSATLTYNVPASMQAASVNLPFQADLSSLPADAEYTMSIWAVSSDGLQSLILTRRIRACNNLPTKTAFEFAQAGRDVQFVNGTTNATTYAWDFGDGTTSALPNPLHTYATLGNYTVRLIGSSVCNADTVIKTVSIRGIKDITTNHGGNTGAVSVVVTGAGFVPHMQLLLRRAGQADIAGDTVIARSLSVLTTVFNLTGKALGQWDVVVVYPGGFTETLPGGFTVEAGVKDGLWVNLTGDNSLRLGFRQTYTLAYGNTGNTDAVFVPLIIRGLPPGTTIELLDSVFRANRIPGFDTLTVYPLSQLSATQLDTAANSNYRILYLRKVPANSTGTLRFVFVLPNSPALLGMRVNISININSPGMGSAEGLRRRGAANLAATANCLGSLIQTAGTLVAILSPIQIGPWWDCGLSAAGTIETLVQYYRVKEPSQRNAVDGLDVIWGTASTVTNCAKAFAGSFPAVRAAQFIKTGLDLYNKVDKGAEALGTTNRFVSAIILGNGCHDAFSTENRAALLAIIRGASDPNAKYGPGGGSTHHYINQSTPLDYTIAFENLPTANANAQIVRVTDTLSAQAFDRSSFVFTSVTIGDVVYALPAPAKSFVHDFDFMARYGVKARVVGTYDATTGVVHWTFFTIDPVTNQVTTNALAGFLPPNIVSPRGQGYVSFTVAANPARQTGNVIGNRATIVFDFNPPIRTNNWANTFDLVRPSSAVTAVQPTTVANQLRVNWAGTDVGSAIQSYDIVYTVNGRYPRNWLTGTSATSGLFAGQRDSTYCFYSVARDSAGNVEAAPPTPDVCRRMVMVLSQQAAATAAAGFTLYPNPTPGFFTVETHALKPESTTIQVEDVMGHILYRAEVRLGEGSQRHAIDASRFTPGLYFVRLTIDGKTTVRKLLRD